MRRQVLIVVVAAAALAAACSSQTADTTPDGTAAQTSAHEPAAARPPRPPATEAELRQALARVGDLPTGYAVDPSAQDTDTSGDVVDRPACRDLFAALDRRTTTSARPAAEANVNYRSANAYGPRLFAGAMSYADANVPADMVRAISSAYGLCQTFTSHNTKDGSTTSFRTSDMSFPSLGGATKALRLTATSQGVEFTIDLVLTQVGRCVGIFGSAGLGSTDSAALEKAARASVGRLAPVC